MLFFSYEEYNNNIRRSLDEGWEQIWERHTQTKKKEHSETVVDKLRQEENRSLEPSVNLQQLRRQTTTVLNADMLGTSKERQWS